jgi:DNA-binding Xre family transcriptional regulator
MLLDRKITQKELARLSEVAEYKISQLCAGKSKNLYITTAKKICEVLNCTLDDAFGDVIV